VKTSVGDRLRKHVTDVPLRVHNQREASVNMQGYMLKLSQMLLMGVSKSAQTVRNPHAKPCLRTRFGIRIYIPDASKDTSQRVHKWILDLYNMVTYSLNTFTKAASYEPFVKH